MLLRTALLGFSAAAFCLSSTAMAAKDGDMYLSLTGGYTMPDGDVELSDLESDNFGPLPDTNFDLDDGWSGAVAFGWDVGAFRLEGEVSYRNNDIDSATSGGILASRIDGSVESLSGMVNAIYDVHVTDRFDVYVGAGAGVTSIYIDAEHTVGATTTDMEINAGSIAYQGLAGVAFHIDDHWAVTLGYRIWSCLDTEFDDDWDDNDDDVEGDLEMPFYHTAEIGLRYTL